MYFDSQFEVHGYMWVGVWYVIFCFDQLYIKFAVDATAVESNWGRVFYTNLWASLIAGVITLATEPHQLATMNWGPINLSALAVSAALGVGMSYFAFLCRAAVSATCFTIIGNVCKVRRRPRSVNHLMLRLQGEPRQRIPVETGS